MGLFNKKQTEEPARVEDTEVIEETAAKPKKKKRDTMAAILSESVIETVMEDVTKNEDFKLQRNGETVYAAMLLAADDIGGINKKANKDEAKGSIVEEINSGLIKTLITPELMADEKLVIIPEAMTIKAMDEFSLLTEAPYQLVYIHSDGGVELTGKSITYQNVFDVLNDNLPLSSLTGSDSDTDSEEESESDSSDVTEEEIPDLPEDEAEDIPEDEEEPSYDDEYEGAPDFNDEPSFDDEPDSGESDDNGFDFEDAQSDEPDYNTDSDFNDEESDADADNEQAYTEDDEIPDELVMDAIRRKFYSDDLGLEVTTEPFDSQFMHGNTFVPFNENRGEGWLNDYLNEMSKTANVEMKRLHNENLFKMREFYFKLISEHCEQIQRQLDTSDSSTQFGKIYTQLKASKGSAESQLDRMVSERRAKIEKDWNEKLQQVADDASRAAKQQYRERFGRQHDEDVQNLAPNLQDEIEQEFQSSVRQMNEDRRSEASKRLDYGINAALKEVSNIYLQLLDYEKQTYDAYAANMQKFIDDNRKDEIARINALAEEQRQQQKSDKIMAEYTERVKNMTAEFDAKEAQLDADLKKMERDTAQQIADKENQLAEKETAWRNRIAEYEQRCKDLQGQVDELLSRYSQLDSLKDSQYASRITELQNEKKSMEDRCNHIESAHKKTNVVSIFLIIAVAIATLAVGIIVGSYISIDKETNEAISNTQIAVQNNQNDTESATQGYVEPATEPTEAVTEEVTEPVVIESETEVSDKADDKKSTDKPSETTVKGDN